MKYGYFLAGSFFAFVMMSFLWGKNNIVMEEKTHHPVVFFEIGGKDKTITAAFYKDVFGWAADATGVINSDGVSGIPGHLVALGHEPFNYVMVYIEVPDIKKHIEKIEKAGGKNLVGPVDLPNGQTFAWISDVDGNTIGILTPIP